MDTAEPFQAHAWLKMKMCEGAWRNILQARPQHRLRITVGMGLPHAESGLKLVQCVDLLDVADSSPASSTAELARYVW